MRFEFRLSRACASCATGVVAGAALSLVPAPNVKHDVGVAVVVALAVVAVAVAVGMLASIRVVFGVFAIGVRGGSPEGGNILEARVCEGLRNS